MTQCERCGARVVRGLDDDRTAWTATADPIELDAFGEYLALRTGRMTYSLILGANSSGKRIWHLQARYPHDIRAARQVAVLASHRCHRPLPAAKKSRLPKPPIVTENLDNPPF